MVVICVPKMVFKSIQMNTKPKLIRITTVPISMNIILKGQLAFINQYFEVIGVSGYDEKHFNKIEKREGIKMHQIEMARNISVFKDLRALWKLYFFLKKEKPSIVHTHTPKAGLLGMMASKIANVPIRLHTVGGIPQIELKGWKRAILNFTEKLTYRFANKVYPNSVGLKDLILDMGYCDKTKLKVLANGSSNGVNIDYFAPNFVENTIAYKTKLRRDIGLEDKDIVFLFVGRIAHDKGINELVEAFERLTIEQFSNAKLVLIGPFEKDYGILDSRTKVVLEENKNIKLLGRYDDVRPYYLISDIFVLPTYREGFPNAVLEAQSMGLPCIVTNINGCNEIIQHKHNGLIVPVKDSMALHNAMKILLDDENYRLKLASFSRQNIVKKYKQDIIWNALLEEYNTMLEGKMK